MLGIPLWSPASMPERSAKSRRHLLSAHWAVRCATSARSGFTLVELLVAMALVVFIMTVLSHALVRGLEVLHRLAPQGELEERLRDALALDAEVEAADRQAWKFIQEARRTGTVDWDQAAALREQYETICASAERLEARLREAELHLEKPAAQLALQRSLNTLDGLKLSAALMVELLRAVESGDLRPS